MSTTKVTTWHLETILEGLEDALKVTKNPAIQNEHGYPYCYGYLEATVSNAIYELKAIINNKNE
jgi:hypothetical protein